MEQQAIVAVSEGINQAVQSIQEKQMQKKDQEMRMSALSPLLTQSGLAGAPGTDTYNAALKQLAKNDDFLKTVTDLENARINSMVKLSELSTSSEEFTPQRLTEADFLQNYPDYKGSVKRVTDAEGNVFVEIGTQDVTPAVDRDWETLLMK